MGAHFGVRRSITALSTLGLAFVAAVLLTIGQTSGAGVARAGAVDTECGSGSLVLVGGTWDPDAHLLDGVTRQDKYAGYTVQRVEYPASIWPMGSFGFDASQSEGVAATLSTVERYQASCEGKPVVIVGYSQGAGIAGDVLTAIGTRQTSGYDISRDEVSGLLYSDPRQAGNLYGEGIELVMVGVLPGLTMAGARSVDDFGGLPVTTVCFSGDPICDLPDPLHDPLGALDGFIGYWAKHGLYPLYMYLPTTDGALWDAWGVKPLDCVETGQLTSCVLVVPSSMWVRTQQFVDKLGIDWTVPDLMGDRLTLPNILGITLATFQPPIRWAMGWFPQLPDLGYGGVLTDVFALQDMANGLRTWNPDLWAKGVDSLSASVRSIAQMPVNFARFWAYTLTGRDVSGIPGPAYRPSLVAFEEWLASLRAPTTAGQTPSVDALSALGQGTTTQGDRLDERALGNDAAVTEGESAEHGTDAPATTPGENHGGGGERGGTAGGGTAGGGAVGNEPGNGEPGSGGAADGGNVAGATSPLPAPTGDGSPQPGEGSPQPQPNEGSTQPQPVDGSKQPQPGDSAQAGTPQREDPVPEQSAPDASSNEVASTKRETQGAPAA
ncbi:cutinase family protein [Gordonia otitidis]|uniref:cutinase family protein n=1 Tax=Gordonia otitidis TaxID=249058 RepID=UPI00223DE141|nr:PE-PPE domain-containing protein [Gordonia otitidis]